MRKENIILWACFAAMFSGSIILLIINEWLWGVVGFWVSAFILFWALAPYIFIKDEEGWD
jgi:membrane protein implicated in regulation of membrane protease activity